MLPDFQSLIDRLSPSMIAAGEVIMGHYKAGVSAIEKQDGSPVTVADKEAEAILSEALLSVAPDIPVVSEENAASHHLSAPDLFFLVDPLDGTKEFIRQDGKGAFTVNIGLIAQGVPVMGLIYAPVFATLYTGASGVGAHKIVGDEARQTITTRACNPKALCAVASASHKDKQTSDWLADRPVSETTSIGSSLKFCLLADGRADVYPRFGPTMEWDTAAGDAILRSAGGLTLGADGRALIYGKSDYRNQAFFAYGTPPKDA
ncbi:MAG: 3'(2'),5'-bisphosphate nucleotidase CysQ [Candidatus Puniceispirillaceae bacterium]